MNEYYDALFVLQTISFSLLNDLNKGYQLLCQKLNSLDEIPKHLMQIAIKMNENCAKASELSDSITEIINKSYQNNSYVDVYDLMIIKKNINNIKDCMGTMRYNSYITNGDFQADLNRVIREAIADATKLSTPKIKSSPSNPWIMDETHSSTTTTNVAKTQKKKVKQLVKQECTQTDENVAAIYDSVLTPILDLNNNHTQREKMVVGNNYYIENEFDKTNINKVYELKHVVSKNGVIYLVVKKAKGFNFSIYTLSPTLCEYLNIPFEEGLTVMPNTCNWKRYYYPITENLEFNPNDLSTYPTQDGLINFMIVKLSGFQSLRKHHFVTPNNNEIDPQTFLKSLRVTFKYDLDGAKNNVITTTKKIAWDLLTFEDDDITREGCICDKEGNLFLKLDLREFDITPSMTCGLSAADIFKFSWVEENVEEREIEEAIVTEESPLRQDLFSKLFGKDYNDEQSQMNVDEVIKPINGMVRINPTSRGFLYEIYQNGRWLSMTREEFERQKNSGKIVPIDPTNIR